MASMQFRTAFRGFNREDVVHYIEYLNNQHNAVVEQLNNQLQNTPKAGSANEELQAQLTAALERFLESLPRQARIIFLRRYWYLLPVKDIARSLSLGESAVKMSLSRSRKKLKAFLEQEGIKL